jgi:hypothetical protein
MNVFDTSNAPTTEPVEIIAGDYTSWKRADLGTDYPPADYELSYVARSEGTPARKITINAAADGTDYLVELSSNTTAAYTVANYHWDAYITRTSDSARARIDSGIWTVSPNKTESADDPRSLPLKMLAHIEAALLHRADQHQLDVLDYSIGETNASRDPAKLLIHRNYWQKELIKINRRERARKGLAHSGTVKVRF